MTSRVEKYRRPQHLSLQPESQLLLDNFTLVIDLFDFNYPSPR